MPDVPSLLKHPRGKRCVVVGGGKTGAAAARVLLNLGADVVVVDDAPLDKVTAGLEKHGLPSDMLPVYAGGIGPRFVESADLVVLSPGVPRAHPAIAPILDRVPVVNEIELAYAHAPPNVAVIAITGTNGKSTTTTMAGAIAMMSDPNAFVGGNLGTPWCQAILLDAVPSKIAVLELSSYQLETIRHLGVRAAVVTNLSPDHLDRYPSAAEYYAAKARIFDLLLPNGGSAINAADAESRSHLASRRPGDRASCDFDISGAIEGIEVGPDSLTVRRPGREPVTVSLANPRIVGHHNRQNAAAAVAGCALIGVAPEAWQLGLDAYGGIAHRLERVGERAGVVWFNDSKGTNVDATVTAVKSFTGGNVHLIAGGLGKGAPYSPLVEVSKGRVKAVYVIGQDAAVIAKAFGAGAPAIDVVDVGTLDKACAEAMKRAVPGDVLLLSPACASFDQFKDYVHRGESFRALFGKDPLE